MKVIIPIVYRFNDKYRYLIEKFIQDIHLPKEYISIHVRAGDKITERQLITPQAYLNKASEKFDCHNIFIATDDYRIYEQLKDANPTYTFYTSTSPEDKGNDTDIFFSSSKENIKRNLIEMFASIEIFLKLELFVGTYGSNPGLFVGMLMDNRMVGIDFDNWLII